MSGTRKKINIHSRGTQDRLFCFILLLPAIILCITFIIIPIIDSVWMSFTDYKIANLTQGIPGKWNNFANYTRLWETSVSGRYYDFLCFCNSASYIYCQYDVGVDFKYKDRRSKISAKYYDDPMGNPDCYSWFIVGMDLRKSIWLITVSGKHIQWG